MTIKQRTFNKVGWLLIVAGIIAAFGYDRAPAILQPWFFSLGMTVCIVAITVSLIYISIQVQEPQEATCYWCERHKELDRKKLELNFPIGSRVICQDRSDKHMSIGEVVDHQPITRAETMVPVIKDLRTGEKYFSLNPIPWNEALERTLRTLPWWDRYNVLYPRSKGISYQDIEKIGRYQPSDLPAEDANG